MRKLLPLLLFGALLAAPANAYPDEPRKPETRGFSFKRSEPVVDRKSGGWIHDQPYFNYPHYSQRPECKPDETAIESPYRIGKWICVSKRDLYRFEM